MKFQELVFGGIVALLCCTGNNAAAQKIYPTEQQIEAAVSAAPENLRAGATVIGYNADTTLSVLREGNDSSKLICLADDPKKSNFHVSCYHEDLEPFMKRGRELRAEGMSSQEVDLFRRNEIKTGELPMPERPMALYSLTGGEEAFNYEEGTVNEASPLYVVYIPYATKASTGLAGKPVSPGAPWLMEPGTPWAHIMVMTERKIEQ